jgi:hypothetical protein
MQHGRGVLSISCIAAACSMVVVSGYSRMLKQGPAVVTGVVV